MEPRRHIYATQGYRKEIKVNGPVLGSPSYKLISSDIHVSFNTHRPSDTETGRPLSKERTQIASGVYVLITRVKTSVAITNYVLSNLF